MNGFLRVKPMWLVFAALVGTAWGNDGVLPEGSAQAWLVAFGVIFVGAFFALDRFGLLPKNRKQRTNGDPFAEIAQAAFEQAKVSLTVLEQNGELIKRLDGDAEEHWKEFRRKFEELEKSISELGARVARIEERHVTEDRRGG